LELRTDALGCVEFHVFQPMLLVHRTKIRVVAGSATLMLETVTYNPDTDDTDNDGVKDEWDFAPTDPAVSTPPNTSVLNLNLVTPSGAVRLN
jgi:hypothetical protein